jgi:hypothetical protein
MLRLSSAAWQLYASFRSKASLTARVAGFGAIFPPTCRKAKIAPLAVDDPQNDSGRRPSGKRQINSLSCIQLRYLLLITRMIALPN